MCCFTGSLTDDFFSSMQSSICILEMPLLINHSLCNYSILVTLSSFANQIVTCFSFPLQFQRMISACNRNSCSYFLGMWPCNLSCFTCYSSFQGYFFNTLKFLHIDDTAFINVMLWFFVLKLLKRMCKYSWSKVQSLRLQLSGLLSANHFSL